MTVDDDDDDDDDDDNSEIVTIFADGRSCLSVCPFVCPIRAALNSKSKNCRKPKVGVNVSQGKSNQCANFQFKRSKVRVRVRVVPL